MKWSAKQAEIYAKKFGEYPTNLMAVEELNFFEGMVVVDVGCGIGYALRLIAERCPSARLIGVDPVLHMLNIAKKYALKHNIASRLDFIKAAAENLPLMDSIADLVLAFDSIDHWQDRNLGLNQVKRILKPSGQFVVIKDSDIPDAHTAEKNFSVELETANFKPLTKKRLQSGAVKCTMWISQL